METRLASLECERALVQLAENYFTKTACPDTLLHFAQTHINDSDKVCLVAGDPPSAVICGVVAPHYLTGEPTAFKTAWVARPGSAGHGAHLLRAFERWAIDKGARRIIVSGREPRTCTLIERCGYARLETVFTKSVK